MNVSYLLEDFIATEVAQQPKDTIHNLSDEMLLPAWAEFLHEYYHLTSISADVESLDVLRNHPLWLAWHSQYGAVIVKCPASLRRNPQCIMLCLASGEQHFFNTEFLAEITEWKALVEIFAQDKEFDADSLSNFVLDPIKNMARNAVWWSFFLALLNAVFFLVNYNILRFVVPSQEIALFWPMAILFGISALVFIFATNVNQIIQEQVQARLQEREELLKLSLIWSNTPARMTTQNYVKVRNICAAAVRLGQNKIQMRIGIVSLVYFLPALFLMSIRMPLFLFLISLIIPILVTVLVVFFRLRWRSEKKEMEVQAGNQQDELYTIAMNADKLRFYKHMDHILEAHFKRDNRLVLQQEHQAVRMKILENAGTWTTEFLQVLGIFFLCIWGGVLVSQGRPFSTADAFIIFHLVASMSNFAPRLGQIYNNQAESTIDIREAQDYLQGNQQEVYDVVTAPEAVVIFDKLRLPHGCLFKVSGDLSREIRGSATVFIHGDSGTGKSTLLRCLLGLEEPEGGLLQVFGVNPLHMNPWDRAFVFAYVDQTTQLLPGTVGDNLRLFAPPNTPDSQLWETLQLVELDRSIAQLPLKLATPISDTQKSFSTGEIQRLALAQCILKGGRILVLDEAMSGLPAEMEKRIFQAISSCFVQTYIVSHRPHLRQFASHEIETESRL